MDRETMLDTMGTKLEKFLSTKTVVGEPIIVGEVTLVPIQMATFGFGAGGGEGKGEKEGGTAGGAGGGATLKPVAIVAVIGEEVKMFTLGKKDMMDQIAGLIPQCLSKIKLGKGKTKGERGKGEDPDFPEDATT